METNLRSKVLTAQTPEAASITRIQVRLARLQIDASAIKAIDAILAHTIPDPVEPEFMARPDQPVV